MSEGLSQHILPTDLTDLMKDVAHLSPF